MNALCAPTPEAGPAALTFSHLAHATAVIGSTVTSATWGRKYSWISIPDTGEVWCAPCGSEEGCWDSCPVSLSHQRMVGASLSTSLVLSGLVAPGLPGFQDIHLILLAICQRCAPSRSRIFHSSLDILSSDSVGDKERLKVQLIQISLLCGLRNIFPQRSGEVFLCKMQQVKGSKRSMAGYLSNLTWGQ